MGISSKQRLQGKVEYPPGPAHIAKVCFIGDLPKREDDSNTPLLNQWYKCVPTIHCEATEEVAEKVSKIQTAKQAGQIVLACGNDPATDGQMVLRASYGVMISDDGTSYPTYLTVTSKQMVEIVLWLAFCMNS